MGRKRSRQVQRGTNTARRNMTRRRSKLSSVAFAFLVLAHLSTASYPGVSAFSPNAGGVATFGASPKQVTTTTTARFMSSRSTRSPRQRNTNEGPVSRTWNQHPDVSVTNNNINNIIQGTNNLNFRIMNNNNNNRNSQNNNVNPPTTTTTPVRRKRKKTQPIPVRGYDGEAIEEFYDLRPLQVGWRLNTLGFPLLGWYLRLLVDRALGNDAHVEVQRKRGEELRQTLVQSGSVALIKSGQAISLRPDLIRNKYWAEELGKLVDAVGAFSDQVAMKTIRKELKDLKPRLDVTKATWKDQANRRIRQSKSRMEKMVESDSILSLFEFYNDFSAVASASIGQVYKARIRRGPQLEAAIGKEEAARWGGKVVAIKVQRPDVSASVSLDMYLLRRTAMWLSKIRGGDLVKIADAFGMQLFGELDYIREANNCERFRELYGDWDDIHIPKACNALTRERVLVMEWVDGAKGPWPGQDGIDMVSIGLRCSVDQLMTTGLFHSDPHRGNLLKTPTGKLALIDFGMISDIDEEFRYSLFGLVIGLQTKDLPLVTENLLKLGFLKDTSQLDELVPRLRRALKNSTGGTGKASDMNFARLQAELDAISRENLVRFSTPPYFVVIIRSLTILEGVALSVDKNFRLVRGAYPYVLRQLLFNDEDAPAALQKLLIRLLTVNGQGEEIEWERLRDFLRLAQKANKKYDPRQDNVDEDKAVISREAVELVARFLTSRTGVFLKKPLAHELAEAIDSMASIGEANLLRISRGVIPILPGMNGPVNGRRMEEIRMMVETLRDAIDVPDNNNNMIINGVNGGGGQQGAKRMQAIMDVLRDVSTFLNDARFQSDLGPVLLEELQSVAQMVAIEVLEIRGARAIRTIVGSP